MGVRDAAFVVLDFETTGLSPRRAEVVEVGALHWTGGAPGRSYATLCRPHRPIPASVVSVHGITNEMVAASTPFAQHLPGLLAFLGDRVIVAHHARFDLGFLRTATHLAGLPTPENAALCTVRLSRRLFPEIAHHDLESLCRHHGIARRARHRALEDAEVTAQLLDLLLERAEEQGTRELSELLPIGAPSRGRSEPAPVRLTEEEWHRLEEAILTGDQVTLRYLSRRGVGSERAVVPYVVSATGAGTCLVAYDVSAGTTRTFRLDRVHEIGGAR